MELRKEKTGRRVKVAPKDLVTVKNSDGKERELVSLLGNWLTSLCL